MNERRDLYKKIKKISKERKCVLDCFSLQDLEKIYDIIERNEHY